MMNRIRYITFILFISTVISQSPFISGEKLNYSAGFRFFSAGLASIEVFTDTLNNVPVYQFISTTRSAGILDKFYKVRDEIDVWVSSEDFRLIRMNKKIREGHYKKDFNAIIDWEKQIATMGSKILPLPHKVMDPVSAIYYFRTKDLKIGDVYSFTSFDNGKIKDIQITVTHEETISVPAGIFRCWVLSPSSSDGSELLKNQGEMTIWYTKDENKFPANIEQTTSLESMVLELKEVSVPLLDEPGDVIEHDKDK